MLSGGAVENLDNTDNTSKLTKTLKAANQLVSKIREYSSDSRINIVVFWGTGYQLLPFTDADFKFTGYTVKNDGSHDEPILNYTITNDDGSSSSSRAIA